MLDWIRDFLAVLVVLGRYLLLRRGIEAAVADEIVGMSGLRGI